MESTALITKSIQKAVINDGFVSVYEIPAEQHESDGTYGWDNTTLILVELKSEGESGIGYTYGNEAIAKLIESNLLELVKEMQVMDTHKVWNTMMHSLRNNGHPGLSAMAVSAVDTALWDLKSKLLGLPLVKLLGAARDYLPVYGSGGFTSYNLDQLQKQLYEWITNDISQVKIKIGRDPDDDLNRVIAARETIGNEVDLFIDANGAYTPKQAIQKADQFKEFNVTWFEEPVSSNDLNGLKLVKEKAPPGMEVTAGEYGYTLTYFQRMIAAGAVDVIMADITRCGGITAFMKIAALCEANHLPLSAHCAPSLHLHPCLAVNNIRHVEYFHDHVRIEEMLFDGFRSQKNGVMTADLTKAGMGIGFNYQHAEKFRVK